MGAVLCSINGCEGPVRARGWCNKHYRRFLRTGDPEKAAWERGDTEANFWAKVDRRGPTDCWHWTGSIAPDGYGRFVWADGTLPHRYSYLLAFGPLPAGGDIDHMCHNVDASCVSGDACLHRRCMNPMHLRAIPADRNRIYTRPGERGKVRGAQQRAKTHCPAGHPYDVGNTYIDPRGSRNCRTCRRNKD